MSCLSLDALRSDHPLGFLAALGVLEILRSEGEYSEDELALGWEGIGAPALLESPFKSIDQLVEFIHETAKRVKERGGVLVGAPPELPLERRLKEKGISDKKSIDPLRDTTKEEAIKWYSKMAEDGDDARLRWICGFLDEIATAPDSEFAATTPLIQLNRQKTSRQVCRDLLELLVPQLERSGRKRRAVNRDDSARNAASTESGGQDNFSRPVLIEQALSCWQRTENAAGANLDWGAAHDAVMRSDGESKPAAVPALEWLVLQAIPWFRLAGRADRPAAPCWMPPSEPRRRPRLLTFFWPIWSSMLDPCAVEVMLSHPAVCAVANSSLHKGERPPPDDELRRLGLLAVMKSVRRRETNADGPLGAAELVWSAGG